MTLGDLLGCKERGFPIYPIVINRFGLHEAIFLCRIVWWQEEDGDWIEKSVEQIKQQTGLSYKQQIAVRKRLVNSKIIEEEYKRLEHQLRFRVAKDAFKKIIVGDKTEQEASAEKSDGQKPKDVEHVPKGKVASAEKEFRLDNGNTREVQEKKSPIREFTDGWIQRYQRVFGRTYGGFVTAGAREGAAVAKLLKFNSPGDALDVAEAAWLKTDEKQFWNCVNQSRTVSQFVCSWDKICDEINRAQNAQGKSINHENAWK